MYAVTVRENIQRETGHSGLGGLCGPQLDWFCFNEVP